MVSFRSLLARGWRRTESVRWLVAVPVVWSFLQFGDVRAVQSNHGVHGGITFPFPTGLPTLWTFTNVPNAGLTVEAPLGLTLDGITPLVVGVTVTTLVGGLLTAGYLGTLYGALTGADRRGFAGSVAQFGVQQMAYAGVVALVGVAFVGAAAVFPPFLVFVLAFACLFVGAYLFYATPFLIVTDGLSVVAAFHRSYALAVAGGEYLWFFLAYLGAGALLSIPTTVVAVNFGVLGVAVGAILLAPVALAFTAATLLFLDGLTGTGRPESDPDPWTSRPSSADS